MSKEMTAYPIDLEANKVRFLEDVAKRFGLPDAAKAVRCLINYAREHPERHTEIFEEIRCLDC